MWEQFLGMGGSEEVIDSKVLGMSGPVFPRMLVALILSDYSWFVFLGFSFFDSLGFVSMCEFVEGFGILRDLEVVYKSFMLSIRRFLGELGI